jgi:bacteriocin biosynthesis cyclodehydratase domain-containing protein
VHTVLTGRVSGDDDTPGGLLPTDEHRPRLTAASEAVRRAAPYADTRAVPLGRATFAVLIAVRMPPRLAAAAYRRRRQPYLLVDVRDDTIVVGPLVAPGRGPCVNCLDLHRCDRDPAWPAISAQLATVVDEAPTTGVATVLAAVGIGVAQVLAHIDGGLAPTVGATLEIGPEAQVRRRPWAIHPHCDCVKITAPGSGRSLRRPPDEVQ